MSIADGEYDIDISILSESAGASDAFGIRYGVVPGSMDANKPMKLYDDSKNLILEARDDSDNQLLFEGVSQVYNSKNPAMANYYLGIEGGQAKLGKLARTVRFNKSRNSIKWSNMIRKWNNELEAKSIISESDFEDFAMEFDAGGDLEQELERERERSEKEAREREKMDRDRIEKERVENERIEKERIEKERVEKERIEKERIEKEKLQKQKLEQEKLEKQRLQREKLEKLKPAKPKPQPKAKSKALRPRAAKSTPKSAPKPIPASRASKSTKAPKDSDDDFGDLENQLEEMLEDSDSSDADSVPFATINIVNSSKPQRPNRPAGKKPGKKPMSLRHFMGEPDDADLSVSEEE